MATRASVNDPCRISDSESDEDQSPLRKNVPVTVFVGPSRGSQRTTPRVLDWQLEIEDEDQFGKQTPVAPPPTQKIKSNGKKFHGTPKLNSSTDRPPSARPSSSSSSSSSPNERADVVIANDESTAAPASPPATSTCDFDPYALIQENLSQFITTTIPEEFPGFIQCRLRRDTSGVQGNFLPTFYLQAEHGRDGRKLFLLAARRVAKVNRVAEYSITTNVESVSRSHRADGYVGRLRGNNLSGTEYTLYDNGLSPNKLSKKKQSENQENLRRELAGIFYDSNVLGFKGPRQISVMLPKLGHTIQPSSDDQTINGLWRHRRMNYLIQLRNKVPKYNETTKTYVIQFMGNRVVKPSVKNFQIVMDNDNKEEIVIMQFGRVDKDVFTCDFRYPLSAIQAFGIALSSFDSRISRE